MGVPRRFATEYAERGLELIEMMEANAASRGLQASFALLAASALLTIPFERMKKKQIFDRAKSESKLLSTPGQLKKIGFLQAPFWGHATTGEWWYSRIVENVGKPSQWKDEKGRHPLQLDGFQLMEDEDPNAESVVRSLRNALAHSNIIYLEREFREIEGKEVRYMAFISEVDGGGKSKCQTCGEYILIKNRSEHRLIVTSSENFLTFVKCWAHWVKQIRDNGQIIVAA